MAYIPKAIRQQVLDRAKGLCEYCQSAQRIIISLEIDHILPVSLGGTANLDNLCASCQGCNKHKKEIIKAIDPQTDTLQPLFNPRKQNWHDHFQWDERGISMVGLTAVGRATIEQLKINRPDVLEARQSWVIAGWHPPK